MIVIAVLEAVDFVMITVVVPEISVGATVTISMTRENADVGRVFHVSAAVRRRRIAGSMHCARPAAAAAAAIAGERYSFLAIQPCTFLEIQALDIGATRSGVFSNAQDRIMACARVNERPSSTPGELFSDRFERGGGTGREDTTPA